MSIKKILIANRGEIALRIIRTCREMGIKTVALCPQKGEEDNFLETKMADEYYFLDEEGQKGYLDAKKIVKIAKQAKAQAIHPGYGFLAENWRFAKLCKRNKIKFIGPYFKTLRRFEDKIAAKKLAQKLKIPTLPASTGPIKTKGDLVKWILKIKPPFVLKALKGGGGIGIKVINGKIDFGDIFSMGSDIRKQLGSAFSETDFFLEKYLKESRHIEFQILGDGKKVVHLQERECTIQRRNQKLFEEAPSVYLTEQEREKMGNLAVKIGQYVRYQGAGTVEFLMDENKDFYFLEINPRLQVEHPVTEAITKIDIVEQQIKIAQGEALPFSQDDIKIDGWAVEARINAEDPSQNFMPSTGTIKKYLAPGGQGIFLHSFCHQGQEISPYFDSLLAKLIAHGKDRSEAIRRLIRALDEYTILGLATTIPFFKILLKNPEFLQGKFSTSFIEKTDILEQLKKIEHKKETITETPELNEEEIAKMIFQIYGSLKKGLPKEEQKEASTWSMAERFKMFE